MGNFWHINNDLALQQGYEKNFVAYKSIVRDFYLYFEYAVQRVFDIVRLII